MNTTQLKNSELANACNKALTNMFTNIENKGHNPNAAKNIRIYPHESVQTDEHGMKSPILSVTATCSVTVKFDGYAKPDIY